jgi:hypothetical protein
MAYRGCSSLDDVGARGRLALTSACSLAALLTACSPSSTAGDAINDAAAGTAGNGAAGSAALEGGSGHAGSGAGNGGSGSVDSAADARWLKYIRDDEYSRLEFEVDSVAGLEPRDGASAPVLAALGRSVDKSGGIALRADGELEPHAEDFVWTFAELSALAQRSFEDRSDSGRISIHMLFVDGHYEGDSDQGVVLGVAWEHRHIAMFKDNITRSCNSRSTLGLLDPAACQRAEAAVWLHEVGHVLGLVDNGLPMVQNHRDPDPAHGRHDADPACVMYWAYDGDAAVDAVLSNLVGGRNQLDFCQTNLDDMNAVK